MSSLLMHPSPYDSRLREALRGTLTSASHSFEHLDRVVGYALSLQATYGGDPDVITAAALLHDLGRSDKSLQGTASAQKSVEMARALLEQVGFPPERVPAVLQAISEHDQPELRPTMLEGRILKDADFLAGFGATGIARAALWTGESGGSMDALIDRLERKMAARIASLEFPQSRRHAAREYVFVRLFLDQLRADTPMLPMPSAPYVVIEGISGAGKSTQAQMLVARLEREHGVKPLYIHEPTTWYRDMRATLTAEQRSPQAQLLLLLSDRVLNVRLAIEKALREGQPVVSDRSYLSSMVYQGGEGWLSPANIAHLHSLVPQPTHLILMDIDPDAAQRRINARAESEGTPPGDHDQRDLLIKHRERFRALVQYFPHLHILDAAQDESTIHAQIWQIVTEPSGG